MNRTYRICFCFAILFSGLSHSLHAQEKGDTTTYHPIIIDNADQAYAVNISEGTVRYLNGNLRLRQDSTFFYGDSAVLTREKLRFWGNIIIQQNDSTAVFSDSLIYSIRAKKAVLYKDVALKSGSRELYTDSLVYHLNSKKGYYSNGALLTDGKTSMRSTWGMYNAKNQTALFRDSVQLQHEEIYLRTSSLRYRAENKRAEFIAPTFIEQDSADVYTEDGFYELGNRRLALTKNAQYQRGAVRSSADSILMEIKDEMVYLVGNAHYENEDMVAVGDYIRYNDKTGEAYLSGHARIVTASQEMIGEELWFNTETEELQTKGRAVVRDSTQILAADEMSSDKEGKKKAIGRVQWRDTVQELEIRSGVLWQLSEGEMLAYGGRPLFLSKLEEDSLYISSDTLYRYISAGDSMQQLKAYYDVRIFKEDLQAVCDSLHYTEADSVFILHGSPLMWSDTTQLSGDTMYVFLRNGAIDRVKMIQNAMIISTPDYLFYNQIRGKTITAWFTDGKVDHVDVEGNAQAIYYLRDEQEAYSGVNKTESSSMRIDFEDQQIATIRFQEPNPKGKIHPMKGVNHNDLRLDGFRWLEIKRPGSLRDLQSDWIVGGRLESLVVPVIK